MKRVILFSVLFAVCGVIAAPIRGLVSGREISAINAGSGLPYGAVRVEYIESTGTQYIDTGIVGDKSLNISFVMTPIYPLSTAYCFYFGANDYNGIYWNGYVFRAHNLQYWTFDSGHGGTGQANIVFYRPYPETLLVEYKADGIYVQGTKRASAGNKFAPYTLLIFNSNWKGSGSATCGKMQLYSFSIEGIMDLVPVRFKNENGENEGAMLDLVSGELFRNQGTGSFVIGPDLLGD